MIARLFARMGPGLVAAQVSANPVAEPGPHGIGIFLNMEGDVVTARHVVERCDRLHVLEDGRIDPAWIRSLSDDIDASVLGTSLRPVLAATFADPADNAGTAMPVFAEGYAALQRMPDRHRAMFNAVTIPGKACFSMMSPVLPGANGSAVLAADGRILAMVVERTAVSRRARHVRPLSGRLSEQSSMRGGMEVVEVSAIDLQQFLEAEGVRFSRSAQPQLGHGQPGALRAATTSAGVICER